MTQDMYAMSEEGSFQLAQEQAKVFRTEVGSYDRLSRNEDAEDTRSVWWQFNGTPLRARAGKFEQELVGSVMD